mmetsp:Transcript_21863/g.85661  ORF Transcript_21863/g.85661 Transcript_21863/m.85661 type:complete len:220 (-) Transcript_21863:1670-2329(-)
MAAELVGLAAGLFTTGGPGAGVGLRARAPGGRPRGLGPRRRHPGGRPTGTACRRPRRRAAKPGLGTPGLGGRHHARRWTGPRHLAGPRPLRACGCGAEERRSARGQPGMRDRRRRTADRQTLDLPSASACDGRAAPPCRCGVAGQQPLRRLRAPGLRRDAGAPAESRAALFRGRQQPARCAPPRHRGAQRAAHRLARLQRNVPARLRGRPGASRRRLGR